MLAMRRVATRLQRLSFETLLCGSQAELPPPNALVEACERAQQEFAAQCSASAPPPTKLATAMVASSLIDHNPSDAAALLAGHPCQAEVLAGVRRYAVQHPGTFTVASLQGMTEEMHPFSKNGASAFLRAAVEEFVRTPAADSVGTDAAAAREAQRKDLRSQIVRHTRFHPTCASTLLRSLCLVSCGDAEEVVDVLDVMQIAVRQRSMNPGDFGEVLGVVWQSGVPRRVAALWTWVQHTSACWDVKAASVAIMAFAKLKQMNEAVLCMQKLAEAECDPTIDAQVAFIEYLGQRKPPLLTYAAQLVRHWYPVSELLWRGEAQRVALELALMHCECGQPLVAAELMEDLAEASASDPEARESFVKRPDADVLGELCVAAAPDSRALQALFLTTPLALADLAERPLLLGLVLAVGLKVGALGTVYDVLNNTQLTASSLEAALKRLAEGSVAKAAKPAEVLECMREVGQRTGHSVPKELESWLELATEL